MKTIEKPVIAVRSAGMLVGISLDRVEEVIRLSEVTQVQPSPDSVFGITNLRGDLITLLDLGYLIGRPGDGRNAACVNVIVSFDSELVGIVAEEFVGVVDISAFVVSDTPAHFKEFGREIFSSVVQTEDELLMLLDLESTLELSLK